MEITRTNEHSSILGHKQQTKRQRLLGHNQHKLHPNNIGRHKLNQIASPPQDLVSSTQDQIGPSQDDHDCQTSPSMLVSTQTDDLQDSHPDQVNGYSRRDDSPSASTIEPEECSLDCKSQQTHSSPTLNHASTTTTTSTTTNATTSTSPSRVASNKRIKSEDDSATHSPNSNGRSPIDKRRGGLQDDFNLDSSAIARWSAESHNSPSSPISSGSSTSSISSGSSCDSFCSSSCTSSPSRSRSPSPSPISSPEFIDELRGPRLKLSEEKIRKIKKRPVSFDDCYNNEYSLASTPTTSSGCSPSHHPANQNSRFPIANPVVHIFQAPPRFVNDLKPCDLLLKPPKSNQAKTPPPAAIEMLNCAICGIKEKLPNISKAFGQNSCQLCTKFFAAFLKQPQQLYCAQDGDCLMTFDRRCQACWIKICLQKFDIEEEHRKIGHKYSPKLLSAPNVSLITIDTSL